MDRSAPASAHQIAADHRSAHRRPEMDAFDWNVPRAVSRRPFIVILTVVVCWTAAVAYLALAPSKYTAPAEILLDPRPFIADAGVSNLADPAYLDTQIQVLRADIVLMRAIADAKIDALNADLVAKGTVTSVFRTLLGLGRDLSEQEMRQRTLEALRDSLRVIRMGQSHVVQVAFTALAPETAAVTTNAIADAYIHVAEKARREAVQSSQRSISEQLEQARVAAFEAQMHYENFRQKALVSNPGLEAVEREVAAINAALAAATADVSAARSHPTLSGQQAASGTDRSASARQDPMQRSVEASLQWQGRLRSRLEDALQRVEETRSLQTQIAELEGRAKDARALYQSILARYTQSLDGGTSQGTAARVLSPAQVPIERASPRTLVTLAGSLLAGLLLGAALSLLRAWQSRRPSLRAAA